MPTTFSSGGAQSVSSNPFNETKPKSFNSINAGGEGSKAASEAITAPPQKTPKDIEVFTNPKTEGASGVQLPDGRTFLGLSPTEVNEIINKQNAKRQLPQGAVFASDAAEARRQADPQAFLESVALEQQNLGPSDLEQQYALNGEPSGIGETLRDRATQFGIEVNKLSGGPFNFGGIMTALFPQARNAQDIIKNMPTSELAETPLGKTIGLTNAGIFAAGIAAVAGTVIGGAVASAGTGLASSIGGAGAAKTAGVGAAAILGFKSDLIIDKILGREKASEIQSAINTVGQRAPTIKGTYENGGISETRAIAELNILENDLNILEKRINQAMALDPRVKTSGQAIDILEDIADQREVIRENRAGVLQSAQRFDPTQLIYILNELQNE